MTKHTMRRTRNRIVTVAVAVGTIAAGATVAFANQRIESTATRATLVELYTSQGCSSCPPAETWVSALKKDPRLWSDIVPVAFHVDYWDHLGWKDPFASADYSERQRDYAHAWGNGRVYTPGFVVNGREWRGWFSRESLPVDAAAGDVGTLVADISGGGIDVTFAPATDSYEGVVAHVALLGFDVTVDVKKGENKGRKLTHDFVALDYHEVAMTAGETGFSARVSLARPDKPVTARYAVAMWVTAKHHLAPIQSAGAWLDDAVAGQLETAGGGSMSDKINMSDKEWREKLTPEQYQVTREKGTERAFTGEYWDNHDEGVYLCVACGEPLFSSDTKFESGSGWPSFWEPVSAENVKEESDNSLGMKRTEVLCHRCESHLGHVFEDGPRPTGLRYCINSLALKFVPKDPEDTDDQAMKKK